MLHILLILAGIYLVLGLLFAVPFVLKGAARIDEGAEEATWGFRLIIIPGTILLWPLLLRKWINASNKT